MGTQPTSTEIVVRGVLRKGGMILACRAKARGHLFLPGGHLEFGEKAREALEREWMEEMGVECAAGRFLGVAEQVYRSASGVETHEMSLVFKVRCAALRPPAPVEGIEGHVRFEWIPEGGLAAAGVLPAKLAGGGGEGLAGRGGGFA